MKRSEQLRLPEPVNKLSEKQGPGAQLRLIYLLPQHITWPCDIEGTHSNLAC